MSPEGIPSDAQVSKGNDPECKEDDKGEDFRDKISITVVNGGI